MFFVDLNGKSQKILQLTWQVYPNIPVSFEEKIVKCPFLDVEASHDKCKLQQLPTASQVLVAVTLVLIDFYYQLKNSILQYFGFPMLHYLF